MTYEVFLSIRFFDPALPPSDLTVAQVVSRRNTALRLVLMSVDESNAFCALFRSKGLKATRITTPHIAGMLAAQWQVGTTIVWQRVYGLWRRSSSSRGGWQGSQLMQYVYAVEQEYSLSLPIR